MRCPLRMKAFDQPDTCDPECAWLVEHKRIENYQTNAYDYEYKCAMCGDKNPKNIISSKDMKG